MPALHKDLLQLAFSGFYMRRWNDKLRPVELVEIDKQAHKMIVAFLLAQVNSRSLSASSRLELQQKVVERGIFDYFYRLVITDIKPPIFYKIMENKNDYNKLTSWALQRLEPVVRPLGEAFWERMCLDLQFRERNEPADRILTAAHLYASNWEFKLIKNLNTFDEDIESIDQSFMERLNALRDVQGVNELLLPHSTISRLAAWCGQLRFQIRWSGTPRVPETSVMGHMFLTGVLAYCCSLVVGACTARRVNNFFAGLVHDLPELLTRDIISPVKHAVDDITALLRAYEEQEMETRIFGPLRNSDYADIECRLRYYLGLAEGLSSEFDDAITENNVFYRLHGFHMLEQQGNTDDKDPKDGELLKYCDMLAAFLEAYSSIRNGVAVPELHASCKRFREQCKGKTFSTLSFESLLADFE